MSEADLFQFENKNEDINSELLDLSKDDFVLVQQETKIKDKKLDTKATTFAKDAFKRFCKNKSSVVAAYIIGFLILCSLILPVVLPYSLDAASCTPFANLPPKLFDAGTGWWDGTTTAKGAMICGWDGDKPLFEDYSKNSVLYYNNIQDIYLNNYNKNSKGGFIKFEAEKTTKDNQVAYFRGYQYYNLEPQKYVYTLKLKFGNADVLTQTERGAIPFPEGDVVQYSPSFSLYVSYGNSKTSNKDSKKIAIVENSTDFGFTTDGLTFNVSEILNAQTNSNYKNSRIRLEIPRDKEYSNYLLVESIELSCTDQEENARINQYNMTDANANINMGKNEDGSFPLAYWQVGNGSKDIYAAVGQKCDVTYDVYENKVGLMENFVIGKQDMDQFIANGWCNYTYGDPSSFELLDENCPVVAVHSENYSAEMDALNIVTDTYKYKFVGFSTCPRFLMGTASDGKDLVKVSFLGLRSSLLLAVIVSAINLIIGIIWGSISGYFGGTIDLVMERICEIIGGIPFIIIMTLALLKMGNSIFTLGIALCLTGWLGVAGRTRTQFYRFKGREYVLASRTLGAKDARLIFKHILPNASGTLITSVVLMIPGVLFSEATLAYYNLLSPTGTHFGVLLSKNQQYITSAPALIIFPSIIISLLMISFNLFGNGLRDALNPSLKGSE